MDIINYKNEYNHQYSHDHKIINPTSVTTASSITLEEISTYVPTTV